MLLNTSQLWLKLLFLCCFVAIYHMLDASWPLTMDLSSTSEINFSSSIPQKCAENERSIDSTQFQLIRDPFGNQIAVWIEDGIVQASSKSAGSEGQTMPDILSSIDEKAQDLHLSVDSKGNAFAIWRTVPSGTIHASIKLLGDYWQTHTLTSDEESGVAPKIAVGSDGYVTAIWKRSDQENGKMRFAEFSLPTASFSEDSHFSLQMDPLTKASEFSLLRQRENFTRDRATQFSLSDFSLMGICPQFPSHLPFPPTDLRGHQVENQFATQTDWVNVITWDEPIAGPSPVAYYVYRNKDLNQLAAIIPAQRGLRFRDHNRKPNHTYNYFVVSVDDTGFQSPPEKIIFRGSKVIVVRSLSPVSIAIRPLNPIINMGATQQFVATVTFSNGTTRDLTSVNGNWSSSVDSSDYEDSMDTLDWCSSNLLVATIDNNGLATGLAPGITAITVTYGGVSSTTTLTVSCAPTIITTLLPGGSVGEPYAATVSATGLGPITFSVISGSLPPGLTLNSATGEISGIPTVTGSFNFSIQATNACDSDTQEFTLTILLPS